MNIKSILFIALATTFSLASCGDSKTETTTNQTSADVPDEAAAPVDEPVVDEGKGIGKYTNVELTHPLDPNMVAKGKSVYEVKCSSCHKLTDEMLVGPGWKGATDRHQPEWIMNFVTNVDEMLENDPKAQAMLEQCMVKMPDQQLTDEEARGTLEFMRKNDGKN